MSIQAAFIVPHPPLIVPEVGGGKENVVQATIDSYHAVARRIAQIKPRTIFLISPHAASYADYIHISPGDSASGSLGNFGAPEVYKVKYDAPLVKEIRLLCGAEDFPAGTLGEREPSLDHGVLVPLHFINRYFTDYMLVRCAISGLSWREHYRFGRLVRQAAQQLGRDTVIVASGDLSHRTTPDGPYGFSAEGPELDRQLVKIMRSANFGDFFSLDTVLVEKAAECGLKSFIIMAGALDGRKVQTQFYSYEKQTGVGYALCGYTDEGECDERKFLDIEEENSRRHMQALRLEESVYVRLAREALEGYIKNGKLPPLPQDLPAELTQSSAGVFVSLKKHGQLRGCIGTIEPTLPNISAEIRQNAVSAATRDPRFPTVTEGELAEIVYHVDVLSPAVPCHKKELDARRYGVIVSSGAKRGLLLPDLEGIDTVDQQIEIARRKAGIEYNEKYTLERFEVERHE